PREDLLARGIRHTRDEPGEQLLHRGPRQRLEVDRGERALARAPGRAAVDELGAGQRDDEHRMVPRPLEQVLDEVEQALVGPLEVLEHEHDRIRVRQPLEEQSPRGEELMAFALLSAAPAEELEQRLLDERALVWI